MDEHSPSARLCTNRNVRIDRGTVGLNSWNIVAASSYIQLVIFIAEGIPFRLVDAQSRNRLELCTDASPINAVLSETLTTSITFYNNLQARFSI